ncbi:hypothetical protein X474_17325 [Dethiosulfatarculus sandiegensis]|uniref:Uncharacterized protein n=1 Tax=Dethiosulfatarculus sandiegensis TaxID=1429043 RepID=A0A0D2GD08_9BACT|nr:hypothetical protein X474_17325 [Dethiosulfatarculus sandiegensis]
MLRARLFAGPELAGKVLLDFVRGHLTKTRFCQVDRTTCLMKDSQFGGPPFGAPKTSDFRGISWPAFRLFVNSLGPGFSPGPFSSQIHWPHFVLAWLINGKSKGKENFKN